MRRIFAFTLISLLSISSSATQLPAGFVYLHDVAPSIIQEMRYVTNHNFIGQPLAGYENGTCILTKPAAEALKKVQDELLQSSLSLKVYDCYRPQRTVDGFVEWSKDVTQQQMKEEFYPRVNKADFFKLGYVAAKSSHTRGSTVDLTIVSLPMKKQQAYRVGQSLVSCYASYQQRFHDNTIDMGTGYDCMDELSHPLNRAVSTVAYAHRMILRELMEKYGFAPLAEEWWHFTLKNEPYKDEYFNFPVRG